MKIQVISAILIMTALLVIVDPSAQAYISQHDPYTPGGTWQDDGDAEIMFIENDAYESHIVNENYEFLTAVWAGVNNQRVTVKLRLPNVDLDGFCSIDTEKNPYARLIQKKEWVNDTYWTDTQNNTHHTDWVEGHFYTVPENAYQDGFEAVFSFLTSSSTFYPGMFEVDIKIYVNHPDFWNSGYEIRYKIWGIFSPGSMNGRVTHDPLQPNDYAEFQAEFGEGKWHARFYYVGTSPYDFNISHGEITGDKVQLMKDFGSYTNTQVTLRYTFNSTDPAGIYVWAFANEYENTVLNFYSWTVHNNASSLNNNTRPSCYVTTSGKYEINNDLTITITATDDKDSTIRVWLIVWYGNSMYLMPDPSLPVVILYYYPVDVPNGGSKNVTIHLTLDGQLSINAIAKDSNDAWNITRAAVSIKGFHTGGGGFYDTVTPIWFIAPWSNIFNLILLGIGVLFVLFPKSDTLRGLGILLIIASFVNWAYIAQAIHDYFTPWRWLS